MLGNTLSGWHLLVIVAIVLLLFGSTRLPALAKGLGESIRALRSATRTEESESPASTSSERTADASTAGPADAVTTVDSRDGETPTT